ncbi:MAG: SDR family oxidoreductase [Chloroflexota bacterium]|nr:SDR family oxidoreductase [Chloroflexota bacterium]
MTISQTSSLAGKVVLVTGGSSGIGFAAAQEFIRLGARVAITGRDAKALREAEIQLGSSASGFQADARDLKALDTLYRNVHDQLGKIDVLFVNAGITQLGSIEMTTEQSFDETMDINFKGAFFTIQKALPVMNNGGSIILNGSVNAHVGFSNLSVYSASKAALQSLARTLSVELAERGIRVNTLTIGPINTPLFGKLGVPADALQAFAGQVQKRVVNGRFGKPEEVAKAAAFLASSDSSFINGAEITADGGLMVNSL